MVWAQKQTHRSMEQNKVQKINPYIYGQSIYDNMDGHRDYHTK